MGIDCECSNRMSGYGIDTISVVTKTMHMSARRWFKTVLLAYILTLRILNLARWLKGWTIYFFQQITTMG